ncbi:MAG: right-handed parallel beta-helix repeat-containing protein [Pseudomonadota bacterium]
MITLKPLRVTIPLATACGIALLLQTAAAAADANKHGWNGRTFHVNCDKGRRLSHVLKRTQPGDTIRLRGTCRERVRIETHELTIVGIDGPTIDGSGTKADAKHPGLLTVVGSHGLRIENLRVQNGPANGIAVQPGSQVILSGISARRNAGTGFTFDNAQAGIENIDSAKNGFGGIDAFTNSTIIASGRIAAIDNAGPGIEMNAASVLELRGAAVTASNNGGDGVLLVSGSLLTVLSFEQSQGSSVTADGNGGNGMTVATSSVNVVGSQFFGSAANRFTLTNNMNGIFVPSGAINNPFGTARFIASNNVDSGITVIDGGSILAVGGLELTANRVGLIADAAGALTLVSLPPNPSVIDGNGVDVSLSFGTRATFSGVQLTTIDCDETVLSRGSTVCPPAAP